MHIRNSAKAIIIKEDKILLTKNQDDEGYFYLYPGGGQEHGETLQNAIIRESMEEIGEQVEIRELLYIREYIGKNHEHASSDFEFHQVEFYFVCSLKNDEVRGIFPTNPDSHQVGIEWLKINELPQYRIYPRELSKVIFNYSNGQKSPVYLGDIN
ncbi:NUDIX domain-containing protein [Cytobacillus depressus]|uniref:NUDIX domain-containing protein n=1 Tax=Cytobacillus depressus TaxID=1602942 RepID=A0A6L3V8P3_9BACI|nr:NUDIX domain-containing protein [Cytobacillus depressus]KAB2334584.1 NUDIX domain-containing protein [Cytobacillus depressus]